MNIEQDGLCFTFISNSNRHRITLQKQFNEKCFIVNLLKILSLLPKGTCDLAAYMCDLGSYPTSVVSLDWFCRRTTSFYIVTLIMLDLGFSTKSKICVTQNLEISASKGWKPVTFCPSNIDFFINTFFKELQCLWRWVGTAMHSTEPTSGASKNADMEALSEGR